MQSENKPYTYTHSKNVHSYSSAESAYQNIIKRIGIEPASVLDVGTGTAEWAKAAKLAGANRVWGIDGIETSDAIETLGKDHFEVIDLRQPFDLQQTFELCICLEVAEHLPENAADVLIQSLARHADTIVFSAAIPYQPGDHHINCQPPSYWQTKFNAVGFACFDCLRDHLVPEQEIHWWYRQNVFLCRRDPDLAGTEARIVHRVTPECLDEVVRLYRDHRSTQQLVKSLAASILRKLKRIFFFAR
ncbi:MAG: class I SAM-dependent methyltransferase [Rubripirellula sp.]